MKLILQSCLFTFQTTTSFILVSLNPWQLIHFHLNSKEAFRIFFNLIFLFSAIYFLHFNNDCFKFTSKVRQNHQKVFTFTIMMIRYTRGCRVGKELLQSTFSYGNNWLWDGNERECELDGIKPSLCCSYILLYLKEYY